MIYPLLRLVAGLNNTKHPVLLEKKDNRTETEIELIKLRQENACLKMENDSLKGAALIMV
jgi:transposase-like protein